MLDDLQYINQNDPSDALGIAAISYKQLNYKFQINLDSINSREISNITYIGMGGSALAGLLSQTWPSYKLPFSIVRDYRIPSYINQKSLVIISSYSGNTEETLEALNQAIQNNAQIIVISSGGKLISIAKENKFPYFEIPGGLQPRYAVYYNFKAIIDLLIDLGLCSDKLQEELQSNAKVLESEVSNWLPIKQSSSNLAKQIAMEVAGKSVVIYAGPKLAPAAYKWKISFNENAKQIAWWNSYSEFNHNEFIGWTKQPVLKPYAVIELRSKLEGPKINERFKISNRLLSGSKPDSIVVDLPANNILGDILYAVSLGDFVSIYSAIIAGINPEPVALIEKLKRELNP